MDPSNGVVCLKLKAESKPGVDPIGLEPTDGCTHSMQVIGAKPRSLRIYDDSV